MHAHDVEAESVLTRDLVTLREMVDFLILIKAFVLVRLAARGTPEKVPLMGVRA